MKIRHKTEQINIRIAPKKKSDFARLAKREKREQTEIITSYLDRCLEAKKIL